MSTEPVISVRDVAVGYDGVPILDRVDFEVHRGEVFGILGGSGCGKSTTLKHMIGLVPPVRGTILVHGHDIVEAHGAERRDLLRRFGVMFQSGALFGGMTLLENIRLVLDEHTSLPSRAKDRIAMLKLRLVGLTGFEHFKPSDISGGMRKRAAIARAMALDPEILFLDEPSAGLDPITSVGLDELIVRLARTLGITFVMVTHELASIFATNDRVILLDKEARSVIATGTPAELRESDDPAVAGFFRRQPTSSGPSANPDPLASTPRPTEPNAPGPTRGRTS